MATCERFQTQLLDHLYGLVDDDDRRALLDHLGACTSCGAALAAAEGQRRLLAEAARERFPNVTFQPPQPVVELRKTAPILARPAGRNWGRWAVAAAVLLTVGLAGGLTWANVAQLRGNLQMAQGEQDKLEREADRLEQQRLDQERENQRQLRAVMEEIRKLSTRRQKERLQVRVEAPTTIQAGARNPVLIHTEDLLNEPVSAEVDVRLHDEASHQVVFEKKGLRSRKGTCQVILPPDLRQRPGSQFGLEVIARRDNGARVEFADKNKLRLIAPLYLTHLAVDKPMYQPGEVVSYRSLTLERFSLRPVSKDLALTYRITAPDTSVIPLPQGPSRLHYEKGAEVKWPDGTPVRGIGTGVYPIPINAAGGGYTLTVTVTDTDKHGQPFVVQEQTRKFIVNRYQKAQLAKELEFTRKSYGPGEEVVAACKVARVAGGKALAGKEVKADVQVDGKTYDAAGKVAQGASSGITLRTDDQGAVNVRFKLPATIDVGEASLAVHFTDGGSHETLVRTIPIALKKLQVEFFPEGGDLVAGLPTRVYFQVRTTLGKPAELKGRILSRTGKEVAQVETLSDPKNPGANQGMGVFDLRPEAGQEYELKIDSPSGIEGVYRLPGVKADGVVLSVPGGVVEDTIAVVVHNGGKDRKLVIGAYCRGEELDSREVEAKMGAEIRVNLKPRAGVGGVYRVTVFEQVAGEKRLKAVAERLIYRKAAARVDLTVRTERKNYIPGDRVKLLLNAVSANGQAVPAILLVSVMDKRVLTLADDKTAHSMPAHFFLMTEVRGPEELEFADFLLTDSPLAGRALDLLLGTQGWRRFAEQRDPREFQKHAKKDAVRLVKVSGRQPLEKGRLAQAEMRKEGDEFQPKIDKLNVNAVKIQQEKVQIVQKHWQEQERLQSSRGKASFTIQTADAELRQYWQTFRSVGVMMLAGLFALGAIVAFAIGLIRVSRLQVRAEPYLAAGLSGLVLFVVMVAVGITSFWGPRGTQFGQKNSLAERGKNKDKGEGKAEKARNFAARKPAMAARFGGGPPGGGQGADLGEGAPEAKMMPPMVPQGPAAGPVPLPVEGQGGIDNAVVGQVQAKREQADLMLKKADEGPRRGFAKKGGERKFAMAANRGGAAQRWRAPGEVREYAYQHQTSKDNVRRDFTETLYWNPVLIVADGKGEVAFDLCDSVTTFHVQVLAHTQDGRLGAATTELRSRLPFTLEPKVPFEVTGGDRITVPLSITNATDTKRQVTIQVHASGLELEGAAGRRLEVAPETTVRELFHFRTKLTEGQARLMFEGRCEPFAVDRVEHTFAIVPDGFPVVGAESGQLSKLARHKLTLAEKWLPGTLMVRVQAYPSTLADLQKGLDSLLREPNGCFEQASTSNYPNVLILNYLQESQQTNPEVVRRARQLLDSGYSKLTGFECRDPKDSTKQGYEWFGGTTPPHEALTAYGLLQFRDMASVYPVDKAMVERTRKYLMGQKDGKGGFHRNQRALDTFGAAPEHITNAYIVWSLTESGQQDDVSAELTALTEKATTSKDPYFLALVANSLLNRDKKAEARKLLAALAKVQKKDGEVPGAETSITRSGGLALRIETTALAVLAWLKANPDFAEAARKGVDWLGKQRGAFGGYGSTQSTILALKALIAHARIYKKTAEAGELTLSVDGKVVGRRPFQAGVQDVLDVSIPNADKVFKGGVANEVKVAVTGKNVFPYTLSWSYRTRQPASGDDCPVKLSTRLDRTAAAEADRVRLTCAVVNASGKDQGMAVAIIGLPAGLSLPEDLKQLEGYKRLRPRDVKAGEVGRYISAFEIRGRELVLYWRNLAQTEKFEVALDLVCRVPGKYRGPASRAYLYYDAEQKFWVKPLEVRIKAQGKK